MKVVQCVLCLAVFQRVNVNGFPMDENIGNIPEHLNGNIDDSDDVLDMIEDNISPVEDEYAGMMGALTDIQMKGDSMLAGIRMQKEMLDTLESNLEKTKKRMQEAEKKTACAP